MKRPLRVYRLSDLCFYIRWAFVAGVALGLLLSLVWQAAQKIEKRKVEQDCERRSLLSATETQ